MSRQVYSQRCTFNLQARSLTLVCGVSLFACNVGDEIAELDPVPSGLPGETLAARGPELRRLTIHELEATASELLGVAVSAKALPEDSRSPFDNDYGQQAVSDAFVRPLETIAENAALAALADPVTRDKLVGCVPKDTGDVECLTSFVKHFGRLAIRRPLEPDELAPFQALTEIATAQNNFYAAVEIVIRAFLQHPEFLYRLEVGEPTPGQPDLVKLNGFEVASRLAFFLTGKGPDDALLDLAAAGSLNTPQGIRNAAKGLLVSPAARTQILRLFQMWMGYERIAQPDALALAMRTESDMLVGKIVFDEDRPWLDVFRSTETFVSDELAQIYDLPLPGTPKWMPLGPDRKGLLSQGSLLSNGQKFGDTSPTQRGKWLLQRITCDGVSPAPPGVIVDEPPPAASPNACKQERYMALQGNPACASCHAAIDGFGFGLEGYDGTGRRRETEVGRAECEITGEGNVPGLGTFNGPAQLSDLLIKSGKLSSCMFKQVKRFYNGRTQLDETDASYLEAFSTKYKEEVRFKEFLLDIVSAGAFGSRRAE